MDIGHWSAMQHVLSAKWRQLPTPLERWNNLAKFQYFPRQLHKIEFGPLAQRTNQNTQKRLTANYSIFVLNSLFGEEMLNHDNAFQEHIWPEHIRTRWKGTTNKSWDKMHSLEMCLLFGCLSFPNLKFAINLVHCGPLNNIIWVND